MRDSLSNVETKKASIKNQLKYEYEKKATADSVQVVEEKKVVAAQLKQEKTQRYALYGGLCLVVIFALFMVNRFRVTAKQKKLIEAQKKFVEHQKQLVDEKQKEVLDSIRYAKRIQQSLLPSDKYIERILKELNSKT
jgi:nucleosome binding factor SPN SPT16 subunit